MNTNDAYFNHYMEDERFIELGELLLDGAIAAAESAMVQQAAGTKFAHARTPGRVLFLSRAQ